MNSSEFVAATFSSKFAPDCSLQPAFESLFVPRGTQVTEVMTTIPVTAVPTQLPFSSSEPCRISQELPNCRSGLKVP
jgi:hypothetical protein